MRLALLTEIPAPFRIPLFNALAERVDLEVFFLSERDPRRLHYRVIEEEMRFAHRYLRDLFQLTVRGRWLVVNVGVRRALRGFDPDVVVVGGWNQPAMWAARSVRRPTLIWVESTLRDERRRSRALDRLKRAYVRGAAGVLIPGAASAGYVRSLGVDEKRVHAAPNAVDTAIFAVERRPHEEPVFLYVGRIDREKGVEVLLRAFEDVAGTLLVVGSGSESERLRALANDRVTFLGRLDRDELPRVYAEADVLVLPSLSEPWGMVLNEAATAGLALVASDAVGAAPELIEEGSNGFVVAAGDERALSVALRRLADDGRLCERFGARSREIAKRFTPTAWADAVAAAARGLLR